LLDSSPRQPIPLTLEPLEDEAAADQKTGKSARPRTESSEKLRTVPRFGRPGASATGSNRSRNDTTRARGVLPPFPALRSRFFPSEPADRRRDEVRSSVSENRHDEASAREPLTDAAVKRKIERQVRDALGDRVRSVEVRVSGRNVLVVARPSRFWQKRAVRRTLETLPALAGYQARIEVDD
jgi:hypothetical protein